jgi:hypothetical protein
MTIRMQRYDFEWKEVKGVRKKTMQVCPRCQNNVEYFLASDGDGIGFPGIWTYKYSKVYAYKCPICPNFEEVQKEVAKAIIKGG